MCNTHPMSKHPARLARRNRRWGLWILALAAAGALWSGCAPACAQQARESWSQTR